MDKQSREAQREAVKVLAIAVGVREAARQLGLSEDRVRQWSKRGKWLQQETKPQPPTVTKNDVTVVTKPSEALANVLSDNSKRSKIGFSKASVKVAEKLSSMDEDELILPETAQTAKAWYTITSGTHGWEAQEQGSGILPSLRVYSEQTIINVEGNTDATSK